MAQKYKMLHIILEKSGIWRKDYTSITTKPKMKT